MNHIYQISKSDFVSNWIQKHFGDQNGSFNRSTDHVGGGIQFNNRPLQSSNEDGAYNDNNSNIIDLSEDCCGHDECVQDIITIEDDEELDSTRWMEEFVDVEDRSENTLSHIDGNSLNDDDEASLQDEDHIYMSNEANQNEESSNQSELYYADSEYEATSENESKNFNSNESVNSSNQSEYSPENENNLANLTNDNEKNSMNENSSNENM
ncbi:putative uncharacterized protein DDB_G0284695 [Drosophila bipectinata]|uniref:putative uncharacterized protein DDB_G0284695 n=1 Tax=Drosophila bipectinata TaxID=42026 RepID=UPI0038B2AEF0